LSDEGLATFTGAVLRKAQEMLHVHPRHWWRGLKAAERGGKERW